MQVSVKIKMSLYIYMLLTVTHVVCLKYLHRNISVYILRRSLFSVTPSTWPACPGSFIVDHLLVISVFMSQIHTIYTKRKNI